MKKITWKQQLLFGILLIVAGNVLAFLFHKGFFTNFAWGLYGLFLIVHPVYPKAHENNGNKAKWGSRIAGIVCLLIGVLTRFVV